MNKLTNFFGAMFNKQAPNGAPLAEQKKVMYRQFSAAKIDRLTSGFLATSTSINSELRSDLDKIRARARHLKKNHDIGKKFSKMVVNNVVGPSGFHFSARAEDDTGKQDKLDNDALELAWVKWCRLGVCDVTGRMSFIDMVGNLMSGMPSDGEFLVRKIRGSAAKNAFNFALQIIDVDRIDTNYNLSSTATENVVRMGVEINNYGRPVAYHIFTSHPNDGAHGSRMRERILAEDMIHGYLVEESEQCRGIPWMTPSILTLHHLGEFEQSALLAARKGADTLGFIVSPDGEPPSLSGETTAAGDPIEISVPGQFDTLPEGYDIKPFDTKYPDAMVEQFSKSFMRRVASGLNVSYNSLASDPEGVNFSSLRAFVIEERDSWMALQTWLINHFLTPVYEEWLRMALLGGEIKLKSGSPLPASKLEKYLPHYWQGRRWQWVDPVKDIEASRLAVKSGIASPQMIAAQNGVDVEDVLAGIVQFENMVLEAKIKTVDYTDGSGGQMNAQSAAASQAASQAASDNQAKMIDDLKAEIRSLRDKPAPTPAQLPNINVRVGIDNEHINEVIQAVQAESIKTLQQIREDVQNMPIIIPAPVVNITTTPVIVNNNVEPTPITFEAIMPEAGNIIVSMPTRITDTQIIHDKNGNIIKTIQTEKDA